MPDGTNTTNDTARSRFQYPAQPKVKGGGKAKGMPPKGGKGKAKGGKAKGK